MEYLRENGIEHNISPSYSPNMNGLAERTNGTIAECVRSILAHSSLPLKFWAEAVVHAARIRNLFPCSRDKSKTSDEVISGVKPRVGYLRAFGCMGWCYDPNETRKKLNPKYQLGIVAGCFENSQFKLFTFA